MERLGLMSFVLLLAVSFPLLVANPLVTSSSSTPTQPFVTNDNDNYTEIINNNINSSISNSSNSIDGDITSINDTITRSSNYSSSTTPSLRPSRCQYQYLEVVRNELFDVHGENLPFFVKRFFIANSETWCYLSRQDLENKLNNSSDAEVIAVFAFGCLNPEGTDIVFMEDEEAEELEASFSDNQTSSGQGGDDGDGRRLPQGSSSYRYYEHVISYFQVTRCRMENLKGVDMVANMSDLRVLSVYAHRGWDLEQLVTQPEMCRAFRNVVALSILADWTTQNYLHHLAVCADHLHNVVEMVFTNDSLTSFPPVLYSAVPNLRALEISNNNLTFPVDFPWPSGFATLPRNLSRTYQFNVHYNFANSFDMPPNLFRRIYLLDGNRITNLTHFQFDSDFQYISIQRNGLKQIAAGVFDSVPSLQFLSLAYNELEVLPEKLFARLVNLKRLELQGNRLVTLPTNIFRKQRRLENLNVEQNRLEVIQEGVFTKLEELTVLKMKNNSIREVKKEAFTTLSIKLKHLELQHNPLKTFPVIVLLLRGLLNTNLQYTDIEVLDFVEISRQTSLSVLTEALKNPTTGEYVDIKDNPAFQKMISLKYSQLRSVVVYNATRETLGIFLLAIKHFTFDMEGSRLSCDCHILNVTHQLQKWKTDGILTGEEACLKGWVCAWPSELSGTPITVLKDNDTYCPLLEVATPGDGGSRNYSSCPEGCACYVRTKVNTVIVDCQNGGLTALPEWVPNNTRELWLQNNTIQTLESHDYLARLHSLRLTSNNVQELSIDVLQRMPELSELHVDDNWLTGLAPDFARLTQLRVLRLAGNPFRCDCTTLWLKDWLLGHQTITEDWAAIKCTTEDDDGQVFTAVPNDQFICKVSASLGQLAIPIAIPLSLAFLLLTASVIAFLQRRRLKIFLYIHTGYHPFDRDPPDDHALYDVTVCCDVTARAWVLRNVIETLEEGGRYKVFFYNRDAFVGLTTSENVRHCVKNSRGIVVVLGKDWQQDDLLKTATKHSLVKCHKDMPHFLTVLLHQFSVKDINDKDLQHYVHGGRYIPTDDKHFTKKLLYEMPHVKAAKAAQQQPKKGHHLQGPEPIALYDIIAAGENEQKDRLNRLENRLSGNGVLARQVSHNEVDVDLRHSGVAQYNIQIVDRQDSQQSDDDNPEDDSDEDNDNNDGGADGDVNRQVAGNVNGNAEHHPRALQNQMSVDSHVSHQLKTIFVWYADTDLAFTLKNIVNPLEKRGHTCILQDRDFPLGAPIQENIVHAVENSTRSIFVLSNDTADNDWFNFAFHVAFDRHLQARDRLVAVVTREEVEIIRFLEEIRQVIKTSSVLSEDDPWFWKRLKTFVHLDHAELG